MDFFDRKHQGKEKGKKDFRLKRRENEILEHI